MWLIWLLCWISARAVGFEWSVFETVSDPWSLTAETKHESAWLQYQIGTCVTWVPTSRAALRVDSETGRACGVPWRGDEVWRLRPTQADTVLWDVCDPGKGWMYAQATPDGLWILTDSGEFDIIPWPNSDNTWNTSRTYRVYLSDHAWNIHPEWLQHAVQLPTTSQARDRECSFPGIYESEHRVWVTQANEATGLDLRQAVLTPGDPSCLVYLEPRDLVGVVRVQLDIATLSNCLDKNLTTSKLICFEWAWTVSPPSHQGSLTEPKVCWEVCWQPPKQPPFLRSGPSACL